MNLLGCLAMLSLALVTSRQSAPAQRPPTPSTTQHESNDPRWPDFSASVTEYMQLRERLKEEVPALSVTDKPAEFLAASDMLALAVERANPNAPQGRFFTAEIATEIRRRLSAYARSYDVSSIRVPDDDERPTVSGVGIYTRYPVDSPMPTMPPGLLAQLPPLPDALEYRFVGRVLILRDIDAALVLDYLPDALAAK